MDRAVRGTNVTFICSNEGGPENRHTWFFNNNILPDAMSDTLLLQQVNSTDGGSYTCRVTNRAGTSNVSIVLSIEPYLIEIPEEYIEEEVNASARFVCMADGFPAPMINWLKIDGYGVMSGIETVVSHDEVLEFAPITFEDNGTYICEATAQSPSGLQLESDQAPESVLIGIAKP